MSSPISANKAELLAIADSVAREKLIDKAIVLEAMEDAIQRAARARYGAENDIRAKIDPASGDVFGTILKHWLNMSQPQILSNILIPDPLAGEYWNVANGINLDMGFLP